jgi:hypothetical protein
MTTYADRLATYADQPSLMRHLDARLAWEHDQSNDDKWMTMEETFYALDLSESQMYVVSEMLDATYSTVADFLADMAKRPA